MTDIVARLTAALDVASGELLKELAETRVRCGYRREHDLAAWLEY